MKQYIFAYLLAIFVIDQMILVVSLKVDLKLSGEVSPNFNRISSRISKISPVLRDERKTHTSESSHSLKSSSVESSVGSFSRNSHSQQRVQIGTREGSHFRINGEGTLGVNTNMSVPIAQMNLEGDTNQVIPELVRDRRHFESDISKSNVHSGKLSRLGSFVGKTENEAGYEIDSHVSTNELDSARDETENLVHNSSHWPSGFLPKLDSQLGSEHDVLRENVSTANSTNQSKLDYLAEVNLKALRSQSKTEGLQSGSHRTERDVDGKISEETRGSSVANLGNMLNVQQGKSGYALQNGEISHNRVGSVIWQRHGSTSGISNQEIKGHKSNNRTRNGLVRYDGTLETSSAQGGSHFHMEGQTEGSYTGISSSDQISRGDFSGGAANTRRGNFEISAAGQGSHTEDRGQTGFYSKVSRTGLESEGQPLARPLGDEGREQTGYDDQNTEEKNADRHHDLHTKEQMGGSDSVISSSVSKAKRHTLGLQAHIGHKSAESLTSEEDSQTKDKDQLGSESRVFENNLEAAGQFSADEAQAHSLDGHETSVEKLLDDGSLSHTVNHNGTSHPRVSSSDPESKIHFPNSTPHAAEGAFESSFSNEHHQTEDVGQQKLQSGVSRIQSKREGHSSGNENQEHVAHVHEIFEKASGSAGTQFHVNGQISNYSEVSKSGIQADGHLSGYAANSHGGNSQLSSIVKGSQSGYAGQSRLQVSKSVLENKKQLSGQGYHEHATTKLSSGALAGGQNHISYSRGSHQHKLSKTASTEESFGTHESRLTGVGGAVSKASESSKNENVVAGDFNSQSQASADSLRRRIQASKEYGYTSKSNSAKHNNKRNIYSSAGQSDSSVHQQLLENRASYESDSMHQGNVASQTFSSDGNHGSQVYSVNQNSVGAGGGLGGDHRAEYGLVSSNQVTAESQLESQGYWGNHHGFDHNQAGSHGDIGLQFPGESGYISNPQNNVPTSISEDCHENCRSASVGAHIPHRICSKFCHCDTANRAPVKDCAPGTWWDLTLNICNHQNLVKCDFPRRPPSQ